MLVFARFMMRDSGLPIHISTPHVTQVRLTIDGEPAIYLAGKETPILVEGTLEGALKTLEAAAAGLRLVETEPEAPPVSAAVAVFPVAEARAPAAPVEAEASAPAPAPAPAPTATVKAKAPKPKKPASKPAASAPEVTAKPPKLVIQAAKPAKAAPPPSPKPVEKEPAHSPMSWFKGLR
jgi:hypothetical protein